MNWTQIMFEAGIPDSPGRDEAIERTYACRPFRVYYRNKRSDVLYSEIISARNYAHALRTWRETSSKKTLLKIVPAEV